MELSSSSLDTIHPFQSNVLTVPLSPVWSGGTISNPWLWIDANTRLYYGETSPNTLWKHLHDIVFVILWTNAAPILHTLVNIRCIAIFEMPVNSPTSTLWIFFKHFWSGHLNWSTTAMFDLAARTALFKVCHPIVYSHKRTSRLRPWKICFIRLPVFRIVIVFKLLSPSVYQVG